ncbi:hypothetical protein [Roseitranquillus sediminis]|uniref:hypothetical protein n=1 Tax=Roseitranquillus sediminis TaxID=2809051 RepID=UPI001D0C693C|nr:hypothetical protein [Roseitranquillus sediminis]MBM9595934.1 hypothetical protein [Roseitranquillus sediminis]
MDLELAGQEAHHVATLRIVWRHRLEAHVISCGIYLETASHVGGEIRRDLMAIHRLLRLHDVGDADLLETDLFSQIDPASPEVEEMCLLADLLEDLLQVIDESPTDIGVAAEHRGAFAA